MSTKRPELLSVRVIYSSRLYPWHPAQCLVLSHAQHMLVPSLSTTGKLTPYVGLAMSSVPTSPFLGFLPVLTTPFSKALCSLLSSTPFSHGQKKKA